VKIAVLKISKSVSAFLEHSLTQLVFEHSDTILVVTTSALK
jgi:hypothetical protein